MLIEKWIMDVEEEIQGNNFSDESLPSDVFQVVVDTYMTIFAESKISQESSEEGDGWGEQASSSDDSAVENSESAGNSAAATEQEEQKESD